MHSPAGDVKAGESGKGDMFMFTEGKVIVSQRIGGAIVSQVPADYPIGSADMAYAVGRCKKCGEEITQWDVYFDSHTCKPRGS